MGAKVAMFLMTSQIRPHKTTAFCNVEIDRSRTYIAEIAGAEQGCRSDADSGFDQVYPSQIRISPLARS